MTQKKKILAKYYLLVFPPLILALIIFNLLDSSLWDATLFCLGYCWQVALRAPFMEQKIWGKSYKYSFMRLIYITDQYFLRLAGENPSAIKIALLRMFSPFFFGATLIILIGYGSYLYLLSGILISQLLLFTNKRSPSF